MRRRKMLLAILLCLVSAGGSLATAQIVSDDFNAYNLKTSIWTLTDPRGDATLTLLGTGTDNATLSLSIPGGVEHDLWTSGNHVPRIMQAVPNTDFAVVAKFESNLAMAYQMQGILVEQDTANLLRIEFSSDGNAVNVFAASFAGGLGSPTVRVSKSLGALTQPLYLRVGRAGDLWTVSHSPDGSAWVPDGSFVHAMTVQRVGLFAGNSGTNIPAHTAVFDYFFNEASPLSPEDSASVTDTIPPLIYGVHITPAAGGLLVSWKTDEDATGSVEYGKTLAYEGGTESHAGTSTIHEVTIPTLTPGTLYNLRITSNDNRPNNSTTSKNFTATTAGAPTITVWYGKTQKFGTVGTPQRNADILGNAAGPHGVDTAFYTLNGGAPSGLSLGPDGRLLQKPGDFKINLPYASLQNGANTVIITVMDSAGVAAAETVVVMHTRGKVWPLPFGLAWSTPESLTDSAQIVDGQWSRTSQGARTTITGYDRSIAIGDTVWTDYEVTAEFTINKIDSTAEAFSTKNGGPAFGIMMRWVGHTNSPSFNPPITQPLTGYLPLGALGWYHWRNGQGLSDANRWELLGNQLALLQTNSDSLKALQYGTKHVLKMQVSTSPGSRAVYRLKIWKAGQLEPGSWLLSGTESSTDPQYGSVLLVAHFVDVTIGRVEVNPVVGDVTPPLFGQIQAIPGAHSAYVRWETNEPGTSRVVYGTSTVYSDTVTGPDVLQLSHGLFLSGLTPNTQYHYAVISTDGSGNQAMSGDSTFITTSPKPPTTFVADEFNEPALDLGRWQFVNPTPPGGASFTKEPTTVTLVVPAGTAHDLWTNGYQVPRLMQTVNNADITVEVKFNSAVGPQFQTQGLVFEQDSTNVIRVDFNGNGTQTRTFIASFPNGFTSPVIVADSLVGTTGVSPLLMRVRREDDAWTVSYSTNGTTWTTVATFFHAMVLQKIGLFAGNAGSIPPAFSSVVDYIRNLASGGETGVIANLKVLLQGAYAGSSDTMRTALSSHIPRRQPYGVAPWNYTETDSVPAVPPSVVDWILLELRSDTAATSVVDRRAAFLKSDGSVVNLDGTSAVLFPSLAAGDYYVVVHHRNHLAVMSASALSLSANSPLYDFTVSQAQARGANAMKALGTHFGLFSGDANGDGQVTSLDFDQFNPKFRSAATGYEASDFNLDGQVTSLDFDLFNPNFRAGAVSKVPN